MNQDDTRTMGGTGVGVKFQILGPVEVHVDGQSIDLGPKKQRSLFALLLINHNRTVSTDRILDALWGDDSHGKENALWVYVSRLRSALDEATAEPVLVTRDHGYSVEIDPSDLDTAEFDRLAAEGNAALDSDPAHAAALLREALDMWRGSPLEDFAYEEFAQSEIARLNAARTACFDNRVEADLLAGKSGELVGELEQEVDSRLYDETPIRQLMVALYRSGRQTDALRAYERFRKRIGEDTGNDPSPELRALEEQILFHDDRLARTIESQTITSQSTAQGASNPYKGLEAFREEDAAVFFGRDRLVADVLRRLADESIVTVVGPSGSGKSSVVRSGVLPAVRKAAVPGSDGWLVASMIPGSHPFIELEAALLRTSLDVPDSLRDHLDGSPDEVLRAALRVAPADDTTVLIVVDQFEELFTTTLPETSERFLTALAVAAGDVRKRVRFLLTLRADFYDRLLTHTAFGTAVAAGIVNAVPMAPEELESAAAGPASRVGVRLEPGLEAALIGDVLGEPGALPLFEFALTDLFDRRVGDTLTLEAYRTMGGIDGSLSRKAEHLYDRLSKPQQAAAKQVFLRLVSITDGATRSRRRVEASELLGLEIDVADLRSVLDAFGSDRLLSFDRSQVTGSPTVEVAHEALLERWERLAQWITETEADVKHNARLAMLAAEWVDHQRDSAFLLSSGRYDDYSQWAPTSVIALGKTERAYLEASKTLHVDLEQVEAERVAKEVATSTRARRNAWGLVAVVVTAIAVGALFFWVSSRPDGPLVAFVHLGGSGDNIGVMTQEGVDSAARELDIELVDIPFLVDPDGTVLGAVDDGAELILIDFVTLLRASNPPSNYPDTHFLIIDSRWSSGDANVTEIRFEETQGAYLMGVAAARQTATERIGVIGGWQSAFIEEWAAAYEQGAQSVSPDIEVIAGWVAEDGSEAFGRPDDAEVVALEMYRDGIDVIFTVAGDSGAGVISAAASYSEETGEQVWVIGADADQALIADNRESDYILTSMIKRFDIAIRESVRAWTLGFVGPESVFGLANGGIEYADRNPAFAAIAPSVDFARTALIAGDIELEEATAMPSHWVTESDHHISVTAGQGSCIVVPPDDLPAGAVVAFDIENVHSDAIYVDLASIDRGTTSEELDDLYASIGHWWGAVNEVGSMKTSWLVPPGSTYELRFRLDEFAVVICDDGDQQIASEIVASVSP